MSPVPWTLSGLFLDSNVSRLTNENTQKRVSTSKTVCLPGTVLILFLRQSGVLHLPLWDTVECGNCSPVDTQQAAQPNCVLISSGWNKGPNAQSQGTVNPSKSTLPWVSQKRSFPSE